MQTPKRALWPLLAALLACLAFAASFIQKEKKLKIACIGDSITYGSGVENREQNNYPAQLERMFQGKAEVKNFGVSGATLLRKGDKPYWQEKAFQEATQYQPDIVVIKLGTNDSKPQNWEHGSAFYQDYADMIAHFRKLPSKPKVWIALPVPAYEERWGIREEVIKGKIIPVILKLAKDQKVKFIDLYQALEGKEAYFPDKIHPNGLGAEVIAKTVYQHIK